MYRESAAEDRSILVTAFKGRVFGLDRTTGQLRWEVSLVVQAGGWMVEDETEIWITGGVVIAASTSRLAFIAYADGRVLASKEIPGSYPSRPTMLVDGQHIYIGRGGELSCFTTRGDLVWFQPFQGKGLGSLAIGLPGNVRQADDAGSK